jgi:prepilin-type N-terminal cleavage/methylation domain-containing protein
MNRTFLKETKREIELNCFMLRKQKGEITMKRAFTLVELLIVMAVMAILVGIALPRIKGMREEGNIAKAEGELRTLKTAIESYAIHHGNTYPASSNTPYTSYLDASAAPGPQIIASVLYDPFDPTHEYYYILGSGTGGTDYYAICSKGPDRTADVTASEVGNGELTASEIDDDIVASNCTLP